jgi:hypothetical protein
MACVVLASCSFARGGSGGGGGRLGLGWIGLFGLSTLAFMGMFAMADEICGCLGGCRAERRAYRLLKVSITFAGVVISGGSKTGKVKYHF